MLTLYGRATSGNVQPVVWALEELGVPYERLDYGGKFGGLDTPEYLAMNPNGRIPVLKDGDTALFESAAILRYLASRHGGDSFWPADPLARAQIDMWAEWAKHEVSNRFTGSVFVPAVRIREERRDPALIAANTRVFETELAKAEPRLAAHAFLCGPEFTLADIHLGTVLFRYYDIDLPRADFPALAAYYRRLTDRPAYRKAVMVSYEALRNTL